MGRHCKQGINDIRTKRPDIATYMDNYNTYHKITNKNIPEQISYSGKDHIYLRCEHGHDFHNIANKINRRKRDENGIIYCPECSGARLSVGYNDLLSQYPVVCKDWDYTKNKKKPEEYFQHSSDKVHWKCHKCGHEWEAQISHRTSKTNPSGCPNCINHGMSRIEMCIYLSIKEYIPDAEYRKKIDGVEFDIFLPSHNFAIEYDGYYYHGKDKEKRDAKKDEKAVEKNFTFLRIKETKNMKEKFSFLNNVLYLDMKHNTKYKENCEIILKCLKDNFNVDIETSVSENIIQIAIAKMGVVVYGNSLEAKFPDIAKELDPDANYGLTAANIDYCSHVRLNWICSNCGNKYSKEVHRRTDPRYARAGHCKYCTGQARKKGYNDLETLYPGIIEYWDFENNDKLGLDFYSVAPSRESEAYWKFPDIEQPIKIRTAVQKYKREYL